MASLACHHSAAATTHHSSASSPNRVYFGYGTNKGGVLQIVDRDKLQNGPKAPTPENLRYPVVGQLDMLPFNGAHTVFPMPSSHAQHRHKSRQPNHVVEGDYSAAARHSLPHRAHLAQSRRTRHARRLSGRLRKIRVAKTGPHQWRRVGTRAFTHFQ
jgi:hypothetical protein